MIARISSEDERQGADARAAGRMAWSKSRSTPNPFIAGTFLALCWDSGYHQDVRSVCELNRAYRSKCHNQINQGMR